MSKNSKALYEWLSALRECAERGLMTHQQFISECEAIKARIKRTGNWK
jgi:hypothetical protein